MWSRKSDLSLSFFKKKRYPGEKYDLKRKKKTLTKHRNGVEKEAGREKGRRPVLRAGGNGRIRVEKDLWVSYWFVVSKFWLQVGGG